MPVEIRVLEAYTDKPIGFVNVYIISGDTQFTQPTDGDGWAKFVIPDGTYVIKVRAPRHRPYTKTHEISRNSIIEIKLNSAIV